MKVTPILTEKSLKAAKDGVYSFWVLPSLGKYQIKKVIGDLFDVEVSWVKTMNYKKEVKKNYKGKKVTKPARKKALVSLKGDKKIDLFKTEK